MYNCSYNRRPTIRPLQRRALPGRRYGNFIDCKTTKGLIVSSVCDAFKSYEGRRLISAAPGAAYSHMRGRGGGGGLPEWAAS